MEFLGRFSQKSRISKLMEIRPFGAAVVYKNVQTGAFRDYTKAYKRIGHSFILHYVKDIKTSYFGQLLGHLEVSCKNHWHMIGVRTSVFFLN